MKDLIKIMRWLEFILGVIFVIDTGIVLFLALREVIFDFYFMFSVIIWVLDVIGVSTIELHFGKDL